MQLTVHILIWVHDANFMQGEDVALFSIAGNHFGYEDELDLPPEVIFDGAALKLGPFSISLAPLGAPLTRLVTWVNSTIVPGLEYLQYDAFNVVTHWLLVRSKMCRGHACKYSRGRALCFASSMRMTGFTVNLQLPVTGTAYVLCLRPALAVMWVIGALYQGIS